MVRASAYQREGAVAPARAPPKGAEQGDGADERRAGTDGGAARRSSPVFCGPIRVRPGSLVEAEHDCFVKFAKVALLARRLGDDRWRKYDALAETEARRIGHSLDRDTWLGI